MQASASSRTLGLVISFESNPRTFGRKPEANVIPGTIFKVHAAEDDGRPTSNHLPFARGILPRCAGIFAVVANRCVAMASASFAGVDDGSVVSLLFRRKR